MNGVTVRFLFTLLLLGGLWPASSLTAQTVNWSSAGPNNQGGRIRSLAFDNSGTLWAAAVGGGLWRSSNGGTGWEQVTSFSNLPADSGSACLAASTIAINGNKMYVGTGEMYFRYNSSFSQVVPATLGEINTDGRTYPGMIGPGGQGVFVSRDGGQTFSHINATWNNPSNPFDVTNPWVSVQKLVVRGNRVFAATLHGLYYTDDDFQTVTLAQNETDLTGNLDLETVAVLDIELGAGDIVFASTGDATFISYDNGVTFTERLYRTDLPRDPFAGSVDDPAIRSRVEIAVAPSNPAVVYITEANGNGYCLGVWKSIDSGETWTRVGPRSTAPNNTTFAPFYSLFTGVGTGRYSISLTVDPANPDRLFLGSEEWYIYTPSNGWSTGFVHNIPYYPADPKYVPRAKHCMVFNPNNASQLFVGSDFGVTRSDDAGNYFVEASSGLRATGAFSVAANTDGELLVSTSNGTSFREASGSATYQQRSQVLTLASLHASDFFPDQYLVGLPNAGSRRSVDNGVVFEEFYGFPLDTFVTCSNNTGEIGHLFNPPTAYIGPSLTPVIFDERLTDTLGMVQDTFARDYVNERYAYTVTTEGAWLITNPFYSLQQQDSVNAWTRITPFFNVAGYGVPTALGISGDENHVLYVGTDEGRIFRIYHAHNPCSPEHSFTEITPVNQFWDRRCVVSALAVDPADPNILVATMAGYVPEEFYVFGDIPVVSSKVAVLSNAMDVAGTPVWHSQGFYQGVMPNVPVYDVVFNPDTNPATRDWYVMVATEYGIYTANQLNLASDGSDTTSQENEIWTEQNNGFMKRVQVYDLAVRRYRAYSQSYPGTLRRSQHVEELATAELYAATFGLGIVRTDVAVGVDDEQTAASSVQNATLLALYPNPSNQLANLRLRTEGSATVRAEVLTLTGQQVMRIDEQTLALGEAMSFSTADLPAGVYMVRATVQTTNGQAVQNVYKLVVRH